MTQSIILEDISDDTVSQKSFYFDNIFLANFVLPEIQCRDKIIIISFDVSVSIHQLCDEFMEENILRSSIAPIKRLFPLGMFNCTC